MEYDSTEYLTKKVSKVNKNMCEENDRQNLGDVKKHDRWISLIKSQ